MRIKHVYVTTNRPKQLAEFYADLGLSIRFADGDSWIQFRSEGTAFLRCRARRVRPPRRPRTPSSCSRSKSSSRRSNAHSARAQRFSRTSATWGVTGGSPRSAILATISFSSSKRRQNRTGSAMHTGTLERAGGIFAELDEMTGLMSADPMKEFDAARVIDGRILQGGATQRQWKRIDCHIGPCALPTRSDRHRRVVTLGGAFDRVGLRQQVGWRARYHRADRMLRLERTDREPCRSGAEILRPGWQ